MNHKLGNVLTIVDKHGNMCCGCGANSCTALWWKAATEHQRTELILKAQRCNTCKEDMKRWPRKT